MKHIIHDWDDDSATRILQTCHRALGLRGRVLIVDPVVPPGNVPHYGKLLDLEMLVLTPRVDCDIRVTGPNRSRAA